MTTNYSFSLLTWMLSLRTQLQENSPRYIWQIERVGIIAIKFKKMLIGLISDVPVPVAVVVAEAPYLPPVTPTGL